MSEHDIVRDFTREGDPPGKAFAPVRGQNIVSKLTRIYPAHYEGNIKRAHDRLRNDPAYAPAMHRAVESLHSAAP